LIARAFDPEFSPGAHNAVHVCLRIQPEEKVTLITDWACQEIAASIAAELDQLGSPKGLWWTCRNLFWPTWNRAR
jgi:aminopeptidase